MVKQKSYAQDNHNLNEYKMRTSHAGATYNYRQNPSQHNHVQVAHSSRCCSSKKTSPSRPVVIQQQRQQQQQQTPRPTAHDRSHLRLDPPDPFYHHHEKIHKNNRTKKPHQQQSGRNKIHSTVQTPASARQSNHNYPPGQTTVSKPKEKSSCCTIL
jgi:hypothetical protein